MKEPLPERQPPKELAIRHGMYGRILHRFHYVQTKCCYHEVLRGENNAGLSSWVHSVLRHEDLDVGVSLT